MNKILLIILLIASSTFADVIDKANRYYKMGNFKRAAKYLPKACEQGDANSCYYGGYLLSNGIGIIQDKELGISLYKKGCEKKHEKACYYHKKYSQNEGTNVTRFNTDYLVSPKR
jgi:TPR repeat protein